MSSLKDKINYLEKSLNREENNYADEIRSDITMFFNEFSIENKLFEFLENLNSIEDIQVWMNNLTSRIILKFDLESEQINDFISDYI